MIDQEEGHLAEETRAPIRRQGPTGWKQPNLRGIAKCQSEKIQLYWKCEQGKRNPLNSIETADNDDVIKIRKCYQDNSATAKLNILISLARFKTRKYLNVYLYTQECS